jgi:hypothetical protein
MIFPIMLPMRSSTDCSCCLGMSIWLRSLAPPPPNMFGTNDATYDGQLNVTGLFDAAVSVPLNPVQNCHLDCSRC